MNILLLSPNQIERHNWGHQLFRNEIGRQHNVLYYGDKYNNYNKDLSVKEIIQQNYSSIKPDMIMTYGWRYSLPFKGLSEINNIAKVHITVDYGKHEKIPNQISFFKENKYDLVFGVTKRAVKELIDDKVCDRVHFLPFSVDTNIYKDLGLKKNNWVLASFTTRDDIYPNRIKVQKVAKTTGYPVVTKRLLHHKWINGINICKILLTSNNIFGSISMKYTEFLSCGGFLLADLPKSLDEIGLVDKQHLVIYNDLSDLKEKIKYYMNHDVEREKISKQGMKFVRENHSCEIRVKEMSKIIKDELGIG